MDAIMHILAQMSAVHWLILALGLLVLELLSGGTTYLLWPSAAALAVGLIHFVIPMGWQVDWTLFALFTLILTVTGTLYIRPLMARSGGESGLNDRAARLIGQSGEVLRDFANGSGQVRLGDSEWAAVSSDGTDLKSGQKVVVKAVNGVTLTVAPAH